MKIHQINSVTYYIVIGKRDGESFIYLSKTFRKRILMWLYCLIFFSFVVLLWQR